MKFDDIIIIFINLAVTKQNVQGKSIEFFNNKRRHLEFWAYRNALWSIKGNSIATVLNHYK